MNTERIRFNSGYHDGALYTTLMPRARHLGWAIDWSNQDKARKHFDRVYCGAFAAGKADAEAGKSTASSDAAWKQRQDERKAAKARRASIKAMRPDRTDYRV